MTLNNTSRVLEDKMCEGNTTAMGSSELTCLGVVLSIISLVTVGLNLLVLYAVRRERKLHTVGNLYIVSLSVADLIVGAIVMPMHILYLLKAKRSLGRPLCLFWLSMDYVASTASIFSVFILCIDRYRSVQQPLRYLRYRTKTRALATILGAWFLSFLWVIPILGWHHFMAQTPEHHKDKCETDFYDVTWFKILTAIINFYLPTLLMLWFYAKIYKAVRRHCQHRELVNGSLPSLVQIKLRSENARVSSKKPGKESPWEVLKRQSQDASSGAALRSLPQDASSGAALRSLPQDASSGAALRSLPQDASSGAALRSLPQDASSGAVLSSPDFKELNSPISLSQEEDGEATEGHCFPLDIEHMAKGGGRDYDASDQSQRQLKIEAQSPHGGESSTMSEDRTLVDRQSFSRTTDSDTSAELAAGRSKSRSGSSTGLDYIKFTWKRLRSHSRQYMSGLHLNRERKAAKQLGFIMAAFILCWIPYFIFFMVIAFCKSCCNEDVHTFTIWLGYINSTLNPLIYPLCNENFKKAFKKILHIHS